MKNSLSTPDAAVEAVENHTDFYVQALKSFTIMTKPLRI